MSFSFQERGHPTVQPGSCIGCGQCVSICPDEVLSMKDGKATTGEGVFLGCIACGHCMTVCPTKSVRVTGRDLSPDDLQPLPETPRASFASIQALLMTRRSLRRFTDTEVPKEVLDKILSAVATAPMGIPPSDIGVIVCQGRPKVHELAQFVSESLLRAQRFLNPFVLTLMRPFIKRETYQMMRDFVVPLTRLLPAQASLGKDSFSYGAPAALLFHSGPSSDPADAHIAATYAMIAAESLGLGSCLLGTTFALDWHKEFRKRYGLGPDRKVALGLILGYPRVRWKATLKRRLERVTFA
jgi:ferredoxin